VTEGYYAVHW